MGVVGAESEKLEWTQRHTGIGRMRVLKGRVYSLPKESTKYQVPKKKYQVWCCGHVWAEAIHTQAPFSLPLEAWRASQKNFPVEGMDTRKGPFLPSCQISFLGTARREGTREWGTWQGVGESLLRKTAGSLWRKTKYST
jgi:hypothetical protein